MIEFVFFVNYPWHFKYCQCLWTFCGRGARRERVCATSCVLEQTSVSQSYPAGRSVLKPLAVWPGLDVATIYTSDRAKSSLVLAVGWVTFKVALCHVATPLKTAAPDSKLTLMQHQFMVMGSMTHLFARVRLWFYTVYMILWYHVTVFYNK